MLASKEDFQKELKRTQLTLMKVMADKKKFGEKLQRHGSYTKELRRKIIEQKKKVTDLTTEFVCSKMKLKTTIKKLKKQIIELKKSLKNIFDDNNAVVGRVVDLTQPQTPPQPKRKKPVSFSKYHQKKLKL